MSMPAVVMRTYNMFKDDSSFRKLIKQMSRKLSKMRDPVKQAKYVHKKVNEELKSQFSDPLVRELVQCAKGCTGCCHTQVSVTEGEALILAEKIQQGDIRIDLEKLFRQAEAGESASQFYRLDYQSRGCVFLDEDGACQVYDDRPSVCRTNHVLSDPKDCEIKTLEQGQNPSVQLLNTYSSDSWIYALFNESQLSGVLPVVLKRVLSQFKVRDIHDISKSND